VNDDKTKESNMVENQHKKITGYRDLTEADIALMNDIKAHEAATAALTDRVLARLRDQMPPDSYGSNDAFRQLSIAKTGFEEAFMRLVRAVAQPASPWVRQPKGQQS
jgi:hypothetical protein